MNENQWKRVLLSPTKTTVLPSRMHLRACVIVPRRWRRGVCDGARGDAARDGAPRRWFRDAAMHWASFWLIGPLAFFARAGPARAAAAAASLTRRAIIRPARRFAWRSAGAAVSSCARRDNERNFETAWPTARKK